jgi:hypothetical protein
MVWFRLKFTAIMKSIGFQQNSTEPYMLFKKEESNITIAVICVDDCYLIGSDASLDDPHHEVRRNWFEDQS